MLGEGSGVSPAQGCELWAVQKSLPAAETLLRSELETKPMGLCPCELLLTPPFGSGRAESLLLCLPDAALASQVLLEVIAAF